MANGGRYIRLHCDEDVSAVAAAMIRARQFDVTTTAEAGLTAASDLSQLRHAAANRRCILTHNVRDFVRLAKDFAQRGERHFGIIAAVRRRPTELASRVIRLLTEVSDEQMIDQLRYV